MTKRKVPDLSAYDGMPNKTLLNSRDVAAVFKYKNNLGLFTAIKRGLVPENKTEFKGFKRQTVFYWTLGSLRRWATNEV